MQKAYPEVSVDVKEALACDAFTDAVGDADMELTIFQGKPKGVDDALRLVLEYEAFHMGRSRRIGPKYAMRSAHLVGNDCDIVRNDNDHSSSPYVATTLQNMAEQFLSLVEARRDNGRFPMQSIC